MRNRLKIIVLYLCVIIGIALIAFFGVQIWQKLVTYQLSDNIANNVKLVYTLAQQEYPDKPIMAELVTAQAILESNLTDKPSKLAYIYNNLFGIKGQGTLSSVSLNTKEHTKHRNITIKARFAVNKSIQDSIVQYKHILETVNVYRNLSQATSFNQLAVMIQKDGYATDPNYSRQLIKIHDQYFNH